MVAKGLFLRQVKNPQADHISKQNRSYYKAKIQQFVRSGILICLFHLDTSAD